MEKLIGVSEDEILSQIYFVRGQKVMIDSDLALLYGVETKQLKRQVRRNIDRFPEDFMFELTEQESSSLRCQIGTLKQGQHVKYLPMVFTEQGVSMLSSILNSKTAIQMNIQIIRIFTKVRQMLFDSTELRLEIEKIRQKLDNQGKNMEIVFQYLDELQEKTEELDQKIGFGKKNGGPQIVN